MVSLQGLLGVRHAVSLGLFALYDAFHNPFSLVKDGFVASLVSGELLIDRPTD